MKRSGWFFALAFTLACGNTLAVGNLADISIYDRTEQRMLPVYWQDGRAYVAGKPGNEYQLMLRNQAGQDVLAVVSVDGVNVISGETAVQEQTGYALGVSTALDIKGWRKNMSRTAAFYFTRLPDSYAARTGRPDNVGVIGAALFRRKQVEPPVAVMEDRRYKMATEAESANSTAGSVQAPLASARADAAREVAPAAAPAMENKRTEKSLGTGHGRNETSYAQYTTFERATSSAEEIVTIYYDSYNNLVARGIIRAEPVREPQPFPARFVPDPPRRW